MKRGLVLAGVLAGSIMVEFVSGQIGGGAGEAQVNDLEFLSVPHLEFERALAAKMLSLHSDGVDRETWRDAIVQWEAEVGGALRLEIAEEAARRTEASEGDPPAPLDLETFSDMPVRASMTDEEFVHAAQEYESALIAQIHGGVGSVEDAEEARDLVVAVMQSDAILALKAEQIAALEAIADAEGVEPPRGPFEFDQVQDDALRAELERIYDDPPESREGWRDRVAAVLEGHVKPEPGEDDLAEARAAKRAELQDRVEKLDDELARRVLAEESR